MVVDTAPRITVYVTSMAPFGHAIGEQKWGGGDAASFGVKDSDACLSPDAVSFVSGVLDETYGLQVFKDRVYRPVAATDGQYQRPWPCIDRLHFDSSSPVVLSCFPFLEASWISFFSVLRLFTSCASAERKKKK